MAVLTYRRPEELGRLVPELLRQAAKVDAKVLVVDNDPDAAGRAVVEARADAALTYVHEPRPGIAAGRNRALAESGDADVLVFIDDDETPVADWLSLLLGTYATTGCAGVVGPVVSEFHGVPDAWVEAGRFFDRRRLATGTSIEVAATNNLLLDLGVLRRLGLRFDERFGLSGGSDTLFTRAMVERGGGLVWCDEAVVVDHVPAKRLTRRWVLQRALRSGNSWSRASLELAGTDGGTVRMHLLGDGILRLAGGAARLSLGIVTHDLGRKARGARTAARGLGMASGAMGYVYSEYRRAPRAGRSAERVRVTG